MRIQFIALAVGACLGLNPVGFGQDSPAAPAQPVAPAQQVEASEADVEQRKDKAQGWRTLLPKRGLEGWAITDFYTEGEVKREGNTVILEKGDPLNGIHYTKKDFPKNNFEIELQAKRIEGNDFLCGLTFPVGEDFCSFIAGGWGGGMVGLSSVDGYDASENATSTYHEFENGKWYTFRIRVDDEYVRGWVDDKEFFRQEREGHEFSTRIEVYASRPLGFCAYQSKVALRDLRWRPLPVESPQKDK